MGGDDLTSVPLQDKLSDMPPRQEPSVDCLHSLKHQEFGTDHGPQCPLGNVTSE